MSYDPVETLATFARARGITFPLLSDKGSAITVGTWLTHELFLAYRQHLESRADENTGDVQVEYWLSKRTSVQATAGDRGYDGVDLLWRKRW